MIKINYKKQTVFKNIQWLLTKLVLLMLRKYINSKKMILKEKHIPCVKDFTAIYMKKNTGLNGYVYKFSADCSITGTNNIINIHKYFMKKHDIKQCLTLLKEYFLYY